MGRMAAFQQKAPSTGVNGFTRSHSSAVAATAPLSQRAWSQHTRQPNETVYWPVQSKKCCQHDSANQAGNTDTLRRGHSSIRCKGHSLLQSRNTLRNDDRHKAISHHRHSPACDASNIAVAARHLLLPLLPPLLPLLPLLLPALLLLLSRQGAQQPAGSPSSKMRKGFGCTQPTFRQSLITNGWC